MEEGRKTFQISFGGENFNIPSIVDFCMKDFFNYFCNKQTGIFVWLTPPWIKYTAKMPWILWIVCVRHLYYFVWVQTTFLIRKCPYLIYMIGFTFYGEIGGKKHIQRGRKLKERLNQKYPLIKSEDFPFFSTCYKI